MTLKLFKCSHCLEIFNELGGCENMHCPLCHKGVLEDTGTVEEDEE